MNISDRTLGLKMVHAQESLLDSLYAAVSQQETWEVFLRQLVNLTESRSARMLLMNQDANQVLQSVRVNIDDTYHQRYVNYYVNACPWRLELSQKTQGKLYSTYLDFSCRQDDFYKTEFFNDWAREQDIHHGVCGTVFQAGNQKVQLLIQRGRGQGHYSKAVCMLLNQFLPHVRQALKMNALQESMQTRMTIDTQQLQFNQKVLLLNEQQHVVYCSDELEKLLASCGIYIQHNQVTIKDTQQNKCLLNAIAEVSNTANAITTQEKYCQLIRPMAPPITCMIAPVYIGAKQFSFWSSPIQTAIYFYDPDKKIDINLSRLMNIFGLTEAEAKVCQSIVQGYDPQQIAEKDSRSSHTVRSQLKSIFSKLGCSKQIQLCSIILNSPAAEQKQTRLFNDTF